MISSAFHTTTRARRLLCVFGMMLVAAGGACVVNPSPSQFSSQDSCPPFLLTDQASIKPSHIQIIDPQDPAVPSPSFDVTIPIQSCAVAKSFVGRLFLDGQPNVVFREFPIAPESGSTRTAHFSVPILGTLGSGCHLIELYVSSAFAPGDVRAPATVGDVASASWFVYVHHATDPERPISECNR